MSRRAIRAYDPRLDLAERLPDWRIGSAPLFGRMAEVFIPSRKIVLLDPVHWGGDVDTAWAHVAHHLDYHVDRLSALTQADEDSAEWAAALRLDRTESRPWDS